MRRCRRTGTVAAAVAAIMTLVPAGTPAGASEAGPTIRTVGGGRPQDVAPTSVSVQPSGVAHDGAGNLYVADGGNGFIWRVTPEGRASVIAGSGLPCTLQWSYAQVPEECRGEQLPDGVAATSVPINQPGPLAFGPDGGLYFAEVRAHVIRRLDLESGILSTYAGNGEGGFSGDGGPARAASLAGPTGIAFDSTGRLYIADTNNHRIREVEPDGTIRTVVGCGERKFPTCSFLPDDGAPFEGTEVPYPHAVAVDAQDRLYMQVYGSILRIDREEQVFRRIVGKPYRYPEFPGQGEDGPAADALIDYPFALTFAPNGDLYFADVWMNRIQRVVAPVEGDSILRHVAGCFCGQAGADDRYNGFRGDGGPAVNAAFAFARADLGNVTLSFDPSGNLFVGDIGNNRVRRIDAATRTIMTAAGSGDRTTFFRMYIPVEVQPAITQGGTSGDGGPATNAMLFGPSDVAADAAGNLYVLDRYGHRVRRIAPDGTIATVAGRSCPNYTCTLDPANGAVGDGGPATSALFYGATHLAVSADGKQLYIADTHHERLRQVNLGTAPVTVHPLSDAPVTIQPGHIATIWGRGESCALINGCTSGISGSDWVWNLLQGVTVDPSGNVYASDASNNTVLKLDAATGLVTIVAGQGSDQVGSCAGLLTQPFEGLPGAATPLCGPTDLALSADGRSLYVVETGIGFTLSKGRVRKIDLTSPTFTSTIVAGNGTAGLGGDGGPARDATLALPHGIALAPDGTLYIADTGNSRVRRVSPSGTITTIAGMGEYLGPSVWPSPGNFDGCAFSGDAVMPAADAALCGPSGVAVGPNGVVYVADSVNNRIRAIA